MCYLVITGQSLIWFLLSLIADMLIATAIVTPYWLVGSNMQFTLQSSNLTFHRYPSVGINTRCKTMEGSKYHCGRFDLDGFATDTIVYPVEWKVAMFFISTGFAILTVTVGLTLVTCCRQLIFGKSIHTLTGSAQVLSGICILISLFLYPLGWDATRVQYLCGPEAEPFYPALCSIGYSFYCAIVGLALCFIAACISVKAESANFRIKVKRRVEEGDRLVCLI